MGSDELSLVSFSLFTSLLFSLSLSLFFPTALCLLLGISASGSHSAERQISQHVPARASATILLRRAHLLALAL